MITLYVFDNGLCYVQFLGDFYRLITIDTFNIIDAMLAHAGIKLTHKYNRILRATILRGNIANF